ncbi:MAG: carboxypeptidase regulatory-like domain-containing protein [Candidatus Sulfopaludibacter sp.]|nr:carboxypeptidase regulatory-like domain-containing protein [Candidatus Sulfopaludibacter sp.]
MSKFRVMSALLAALLVSAAGAQPTTGTVKGVLADDSGAVIPAATVTLTGRGAAQTIQSQGDGSYTFSGIVPGDYTVAVSLAGFAPFTKAIAVAAGGTVQVPVQLTVRAEKQEVTVQGEATSTVSVEPDNNATALVIRGTDLEALPDDPDDLSDALQALAGPGAGPNGGQIYIDGFSGGQLPPKESIREIRINQNPFSAEYDRLGFGRIEILTKPGTDKLRGAVNLMDSDGVFNSRNPFSNIKPDYSSRMWSANVGGSASKKASFFMDFNRRDVKDNSVIVAQYFDPKTLTQSAINTSVLAPSTFTILAPRVDYAISPSNTLTVRVEERLNSRDNAGPGGIRLPAPYSNLGYNTTGNGQNIMVTESSILNAKAVNETRFQFFRNYMASPGDMLPQINVAGAFVTGGNGLGDTHDLSKHLELQNNTSISQGTHTIRFGVRVRRDSDQSNQPGGFAGSFTFLGGVEPVLDATNQAVTDSSGNPLTVNLTSLQQYERNVYLSQAGLTGAQIQALGGGPSRFSIEAGQSYISARRWDFGPFIQDDWRVRPNLTVSTGLRYEVQTLVGDHRDWAPRIGFAWAPGSSANGNKRKTVIRGGLGLFYDRINLGLFETAALNNGVNQLNYTVYNPTFYPNIPALSSLSAGQNSISRIDPNLRADYAIQSAIGVERQLPRNTTLAVTYSFNRTDHMLQTIPVNTPLPGTFNPALPLSATNGLFPYGYSAGNIFQTESGGYMRQHLIMVNFNTRFSSKVSLFGNYSLGYANDIPGSPTNPYNFSQDWGRSNFDRRHNFQLIGNVIAPAGIRVSPFITMRSGQPYDILAGEDLYGDTMTNARAAFVSTASCAGVVRSGDSVCSPYGTFGSTYSVTNPGTLVPRNYLTMPGLISVNMRISRTFGFGGVPKKSQMNSGMPGGMPSAGVMGLSGGGGGGHGPGGPGGGGPPGGGMGGPGGGRGMMGGDTTEHPYNLTLSANFENVLNHLNPGGYQGVITSPYFLQATAVNTGFGGGGPGGGPGGFGGAANNRRIQLGLRFTF